MENLQGKLNENTKNILQKCKFILNTLVKNVGGMLKLGWRKRNK